MNDLDRQLREYVDAVAEPVTLDEVVRPRPTRRVWRTRPWIAVAAGAAAVLIPTLVVIAIAQLSGSDPTVPPASSITTGAPDPTTPDPTAPSTTLPSTTAPPTTAAPVEPILPAGGLQGSFVVATWQRMIQHDTSGTPSVALEYEDRTPLAGPAIASDRNGGLYIAENGTIGYLAPGATERIAVPAHPDAIPANSSALAWLTVDGRGMLLHFGFTEADFYGFDPATGATWREGVSESLANGLGRFIGERFALLTDASGADWTIEAQGTSDVYLTVGDQSDTVSLRVSTDRERVVQIHDFDGRRVLLSRHPGEPVGANATYVLIDLECPGITACIQTLVDQPGTAALNRSMPSEGDLAAGTVDLGGCSSTGTDERLVTDDPSLPEAVQLTRGRMLRLAADCNIADLHLFAAESGTALVYSHAFVDGIAGGEMIGYRPLADIVELFQFDPATGAGTYVWPAVADPSIDWENLTDTEIDVLAETYDRAVLEESRLMGWYQGWWIEIAEDGRWQFYGRGLT